MLNKIPRICSFNNHNLTLEEIKPGMKMTKPIGVQGQAIMDTIRYMNRKPANVQLSVLTKSQFVHDDGALLERYFLGIVLEIICHHRICHEKLHIWPKNRNARCSQNRHF